MNTQSLRNDSHLHQTLAIAAQSNVEAVNGSVGAATLSEIRQVLGLILEIS